MLASIHRRIRAARHGGEPALEVTALAGAVPSWELGIDPPDEATVAEPAHVHFLLPGMLPGLDLATTLRLSC